MKSQFKNPLPRKAPPVAQSDEWLTGSTPPAAPGDQSQGNASPAGQNPPQLGGGLFVPPWKPGAHAATSVAEQETIKQPSMPAPNGLHAPNSMPQTPDAYVQGRFGRYGSGAGPVNQLSPAGFNNGPQNMLPGMAAPQRFAPGQGPISPVGSGMYGGPASSAQGFNSLQQMNPASSLSMGGVDRLTAPPRPLPGTFNPNRPMGPGSFGAEARKTDGPPSKGSGGKKRKKKRKVPIWARVVIIILLTLLLGGGGGGWWYYQANFAGSVSAIVGQQVQRAKGEEDPNTNLTNGILTGPRVNILLLGSDTDQKFQGNFIAQTDIVVTIDPSSNTVGMLSIPRDFYINVPGYGMHKLDEAYGLGGVKLSRETIEQDFGIPINYYAWVGLDGFIKVINEVGGVDVDVLHPIVDDNYPDDVGTHANNPYAVKRLYLQPGPQHLDGPTALEYVRSRHADLVGDFGRSARQQQVLSALKTKLSNPDVFSKLSSIASDLKGYLTTDMQLPDVLKLMNFARSLDPNKIQKLTLGPPYSGSGKAPQGGADAGADVVIPNCALIIPAIAKMLQLGNKAACNIEGSPGIDSTGTNTSLPLAYTTGKASSLACSSSADIAGLSGLIGDSTGNLGGNPANLFGVQSLLDLLLMGTFESPDVF